MAVEADWVVEFRFERTFGFIRSTQKDGKTTVVGPDPANDKWFLLAEGTYKECSGHAREGFMQPRPLESCVKRVHRMLAREKDVLVRIRNVKTGEIVPGAVFV